MTKKEFERISAFIHEATALINGGKKADAMKYLNSGLALINPKSEDLDELNALSSILQLRAYPKIPKWHRKNPGERFNAGFFRCLGYNFGICS
jgi:hypothetical protein